MCKFQFAGQCPMTIRDCLAGRNRNTIGPTRYRYSLTNSNLTNFIRRAKQATDRGCRLTDAVRNALSAATCRKKPERVKCCILNGAFQDKKTLHRSVQILRRVLCFPETLRFLLCYGISSTMVWRPDSIQKRCRCCK